MFTVEALPGVTGTYELPLDERDYDAGPSDLTLFALDSRRRNELSGSVEEASGKVTVREATCDPEPRLSITIDARLASEIGLRPTAGHGRDGLRRAARRRGSQSPVTLRGPRQLRDMRM